MEKALPVSSAITSKVSEAFVKLLAAIAPDAFRRTPEVSSQRHACTIVLGIIRRGASEPAKAR
ncbi:hypothetical protein [Brevundimonas diminuta]|uniref:hypothetical protein n=1 Tax=Brevundimonas diminuta TaxID=293 RepID=UPI003208175F